MAAAHRFAVRVYFEDTDFTARVYHGAFVRFFERGRTEMLRAAGLDHAGLSAADPALFFTIRAMSLRFLGPAFIDDELHVLTRPLEPPRASIVLGQTIVRGATPLCEATVELCVITAGGRPVRPSRAIRNAFPAERS
mgnify:CR=1 FL=1